MSRHNCEICGAQSRSARCFRHKRRAPIQKKVVKKRGAFSKKAKKITPNKDGLYGKPKSLKNLKTALNQVISKYVRLRDSDEKGWCMCITCPNVEYWKYMDNGHYIRRKHASTLFHLKNINAQCKTCNQVRDPREMEAAYEIAIDIKWGTGTAEELLALKHQTKRFSVLELQEMISFFSDEIIRLKREKNLP